jgi:predicted Zn-dependent peptidase
MERAVVIPPPASHVRRQVLDGGARVVTDAVAGSAAATVAVWVGVGGRDEDDADAGASHFLEHLLFKGTAERTATEIAFEVDGMGGDMNAYTSSEYTAYYLRVPAAELDRATDLLLDVVAAPALRPEEFEVERSVILEELAAAEDDPEDLVGVQLHQALVPSHPLGREVLGEESTIRSLTRDRVAEFFEGWYRPANLVVTAAGGVDHDRLVEQVGAHVDGMAAGSSPARRAPMADVIPRVALAHPTDLVHLALGWRLDAELTAERFTLGVLNQVLGSGPASRLFQEVREQRALTYSITSGVSHYVDAGVWGIQCSTTPGHAEEVLQVVRHEVGRLAAEGITDAELERAKRSLRGSMLLALEDSGSRASRLGVAETTRGHYTPVEEHLARLEAVSAQDAAAMAARALGGTEVLSVVGPEDLDLDRLS